MKVKLHEPTFGEEEIEAAVAVMRSTNVTMGVKVKEFEEAFGPNSVMVNSGSSANLLAIAALCNPLTENRLTPGDEVIVSALSWSTTVWPLVQHGLIPVIVDIDPETLNMDLSEAGRAIGPRTRALMPVHVYGNPCPPIPDAVDYLIHDRCEALGTHDPGGDIDTFSFYYSHHITTLEGGLVRSLDGRLTEMLRVLRSHGWAREMESPPVVDGIDPKFLFVNEGYNVRPTEVAAAIGLVQIPKLVGFVEARRKAAAMLTGIFQKYGHFMSIQKETPGGESSWFGFPLTIAADAPFNSAELRQNFEKDQIETRAIICGNIARQPGMKLWPHRVVGDLKHADHVMRNGFSIGCHQEVGGPECAYVEEVLDGFMKDGGWRE